MKRIVFYLLLACISAACSFTLHAQADVQHFSVSGTLKADGKPVTDELVYLFDVDSTLVKSELSDAQGLFHFSVTPGKYFVVVQNPLYIRYVSELFLVEADTALPAITLQETASEMAQVEIRATRPVIERLPGKMVFNVEQSLQATGSSAWEVIARAPGVNVTSTDQISVNGKSGIIVQINGKQLRMSGSDLADYLRAIGSASIEKIEFITNPSANYDAAGTVIIDIRLKKDVRFGTNGTVSASTGHGYYPKAGFNFQLNHRTQKWNHFMTYGYAYRKGFNDLRLDRKFYDGDSLYLVYNQQNYMVFPFQSHLLRAGTDFQPSDKHVFSLVVSGAQNGFTRDGENSSDVLNGYEEKTAVFTTNLGGRNRMANAGANFNYAYTSDTLGSKWVFDYDFAYYVNTSRQDITTRFFNASGQENQPRYVLFGDLNGDLYIHALKADREKVLKKGRFDYGMKSSYVQADNDVKFFDRSNGTDVLDTSKSNHFLYDEWISAAYASVQQSWKKWSFNAGLRGELTHIRGRQVVKEQEFDTSYFQVFPTVSLGWSPREKHHFDLNLNRRIERPNYGQLNPFKFYLDPTTYREGNPYLRPQTTYTAELAYTFKDRFFFQGGFARTTNNIIEIIAPSAPNPNVTIQTNVNLAFTDLVYFNASLPFELKKWWTLRLDAGAYQALYSGNAASTQLAGAGTWNANGQLVNQVLVGKKHSFELTGQVQSREVYAFDRIRPRGGVGFGYQWRCMENKGTLRFNVTDLFYTEPIFADVAFTGYREYFEVRRETRVATVAFSYRFGNMRGGQMRRGGGADELRQRAGGGLG